MLFPNRPGTTHRRGFSLNKPVQKDHKRKASEALYLVSLEGKSVTKAPKIYSNQIFCDVYDSKGNHDRRLDTSEVKEEGPKVIFKWEASSKDAEKENVVQPNRLWELKELQDLIKLPTIDRHNESRKRIIRFFN
jgi:hypothetical protein